MRFEQLSQAVAVAKNGNMSRTAEELFLSQPNLSIAIKNLEDELGYKIFIRNNRGVQLTSMGKIFIRSAEKILEQLNQLTALNCSGELDRIRVLSVAAMPYRYLTEVGIRLYNSYRDAPIHLTLKSGSRDEIIDLVSSGECEIGILGIYSHFFETTASSLAAKGLRFTKIIETPICILVGKQNPLYNRKESYVTREMLEGKCFVGFSELEYGAYASLPDILGLGQSHCPQRIYASNWSIILDIIRNTDSFSIVSTNRKAYSKVKYYDDVRSFTLKDCDHTNILGWIIREDSGLTPLAQKYLKILLGFCL